MTAGVSAALVVAVVVQLGCQFFKFINSSAHTRTFAWRRLFSAGGMPSSHTAFVVTLSTAIALRSGITSDLFAITCALSMIVIHDTLKVRGAIQLNSEALRQIIAPMPEETRPETSHNVGHSIPEVAAGLLVGIAAATIARTLNLI